MGTDTSSSGTEENKKKRKKSSEHVVPEKSKEIDAGEGCAQIQKLDKDSVNAVQKVFSCKFCGIAGTKEHVLLSGSHHFAKCDRYANASTQGDKVQSEDQEAKSDASSKES